MSWIENLDYLGRRFVRLTRGDIPVTPRSKELTGEIRNKPGVRRQRDEPKKISSAYKMYLRRGDGS